MGCEMGNHHQWIWGFLLERTKNYKFRLWCGHKDQTCGCQEGAGEKREKAGNLELVDVSYYIENG